MYLNSNLMLILFLRKFLNELFIPLDLCQKSFVVGSTCTLLLPGVELDAWTCQLASKVILPEFSKPNISTVVLQRTGCEVLIEP